MLSYKFQTVKISFRFQSMISHSSQYKQVYLEFPFICCSKKPYERGEDLGKIITDFIVIKCNLRLTCKEEHVSI